MGFVYSNHLGSDMKVNKININNIAFQHGHKHDPQTGECKKTAGQKVRAAAPFVLVTIPAILGTMTLISKLRKGDGRVAKFLKESNFAGEKFSQIADFNMFKPSTYKNLVKKAQYGPVDVLAMAAASLAAGVGLGCTIDKNKEDRKAKYRETVAQYVGNFIFPVTCLAGASGLMNKAFDKGLFKNIIENAKDSKIMKGQLKIIPVVSGFLIGMFGGNRIANAMNNKIFGKEEFRGIKASDMSAHIDDTCMTVALIGKEFEKCKAFGRFIPPALTVCGVSAGMAKSKECK